MGLPHDKKWQIWHRIGDHVTVCAVNSLTVQVSPSCGMDLGQSQVPRDGIRTCKGKVVSARAKQQGHIKERGHATACKQKLKR